MTQGDRDGATCLDNGAIAVLRGKVVRWLVNVTIAIDFATCLLRWLVKVTIVVVFVTTFDRVSTLPMLR